MIEGHTVGKFVVGHVLAGSVVILGTILLTFVCYILALANSPDAFDSPPAVVPKFLMVMFLATLFAVIVSTGCLLLSALLTWIRTKGSFPAWLPVIAIPCVAFAVVLLLFHRTRGTGFAVVVTGIVFVYFGAYWGLLTSSAAAIDFLRRKLLNKRVTQ